MLAMPLLDVSAVTGVKDGHNAHPALNSVSCRACRTQRWARGCDAPTLCHQPTCIVIILTLHVSTTVVFKPVEKKALVTRIKGNPAWPLHHCAYCCTEIVLESQSSQDTMASQSLDASRPNLQPTCSSASLHQCTHCCTKRQAGYAELPRLNDDPEVRCSSV